MNSSSAPLLTVDSLTLAYGQTNAVEKVSFSVEPGEFIFIVGRNGSGKSTLLKGILGLLKPVSGRVVNSAGPDLTAYLPQEQSGSADFPATAWEVVLSGRQTTRRWLPFYSKTDRDQARKALETLSITDISGRPLHKLSGGQRRRVLIARCLCRNPKLIILDEPYNCLDSKTCTSLSSLFVQLRQQQGVSIIMASHDLEAASQSGRVLEMATRLVFDGSSRQWRERRQASLDPVCGFI